MWMYILKNLPIEHAIQIWFITFHLKDQVFMDFLLFNMQYLPLAVYNRQYSWRILVDSCSLVLIYIIAPTT